MTAQWQTLGGCHRALNARRDLQRIQQLSRNTLRRPRSALAYSLKDNIQDWRIKELVEVANQYFQDIWSKGDLNKADALLADDFVHNDAVWGRQQLVAGPKAFKRFVENVRLAYPDFSVRITEVGVCNTTRLFVHWQGEATNLGSYHDHKPSKHSSSISGINLMSFTEDRSQLKEVLVYRVPLAEDRSELGELGGDSLHELHLHQLQ
ncbi:hypothetical protein WJX81_000299 [Elliptochloris bilobata]|uniref:SnoaL-like domain-containing protein n=1 Tax=Elliptochloris bilobata TaxID=381761 RepID=A0AAW1RNG2_9CHLO